MNLHYLATLGWELWAWPVIVIGLLILIDRRLKLGGPRLKVVASPGKGWAEFNVSVRNIGSHPAVIESARLRSFYRGFFGIRREVELRAFFSLSGSELNRLPLSIRFGESWEFGIGPVGGRPLFPNRPLKVIIEVNAERCSKPYRGYPDQANFNKYARAMAIKTLRRIDSRSPYPDPTTQASLGESPASPAHT